jgi:hypothetical protein
MRRTAAEEVILPADRPGIAGGSPSIRWPTRTGVLSQAVWMAGSSCALTSRRARLGDTTT